MLNKLIALSCFVFALSGCYAGVAYDDDYMLVHRGYYSSPGIWVAPVYVYRPYYGHRYYAPRYREEHGWRR